MARKLILATLLLVLGGYFLSAQDDLPEPKPLSGITRKALDERMEMLQKGLVDARQRMERAQADANVYDGAMQECQHWIDYLEAQKKVGSDFPSERTRFEANPAKK